MSLTIFGKDLPLYGLFFFLGVGVAAVLTVFMIKKRKLDGFDFTCAAIFTMIGAIVGAKVLYWLVSIKDMIELFQSGKITFIDIIKGGFVFYGGLLGGVFGLWLYGKCFKVDVRDHFDIFATVLPLGHAFGRVGCQFAGCCYGVEYDGFLSLPTWTMFIHPETGETLYYGWGPNRLAVPIMEACVLLILFGVLMWLYYKKNKRGLNMSVYFLTYATWRFIIEFFRGDDARGVFLLSTSQWISVGIIAAVVGMLLYQRYHKKAVTTDEAQDETPAVETTNETETAEQISPVENVDTVETVETKEEAPAETENTAE